MYLTFFLISNIDFLFIYNIFYEFYRLFFIFWNLDEGKLVMKIASKNNKKKV